MIAIGPAIATQHPSLTPLTFWLNSYIHLRALTKVIVAMNRPLLTPVASALAWLAVLVTLAPSASACCCTDSNSKLKSCCAEGEARKACCQEKTRTARLRLSDHELCSNTLNGQRDCKAQCRCGIKGFVGERAPVLIANDASQAVHHQDQCWASMVYMPLTLVDCVTSYSLKVDTVLTYEKPSAQILLGVWRN